MVQAADFEKLHDLPCRGELDRPEAEGVLVEREVGTRLMVVGEVSGRDAAEMSLAEDEHVVQTLAPDRADEPFREGILRAVSPHSPKRPRASATSRAERCHR